MKNDPKKELRDSLDELIDYDLPDEVDGLNETQELEKVKPKSSAITTYKGARKKAKRVMNSLLKFYLTEDIIEEHEYIKAKKKIDTTALSMLIKQMENSEYAITVLMDTIDEGDTSPRMFEVLSDLQRTLLDIIKSQTMYMVAVEENAKKMSRDVDIYQGSSDSNTNKGKNGGTKSRGTKDLMKALQNSMDEENIQDADTTEDEK